MVEFISDLIERYEKLFTERANPVTREWFIVKSPYLVPTIVITYLLFVLKIGPWYMKNRRPYELNNAIKLHNLSQMLLSLCLLQLCTWRIFFTDFDWYCQQTDIDNPYFQIEAIGCYLYLIAKLTELFDTVFFVLRKSFRQITFLHVFHHTLMVVVCWAGSLYNPGGNSAIIGLFNTAVHVVMYSYYLIANLGEKYRKYLWWKKYVTVFQLVQFAIVGAHAFNSLFYPYCGYPLVLKLIILTQSVAFFKMFSDFYIKTYWNEKPRKPDNNVANKDSSNGVYTNGKKSSTRVHIDVKESSNGVHTNGKNKLL